MVNQLTNPDDIIANYKQSLQMVMESSEETTAENERLTELLRDILEITSKDYGAKEHGYLRGIIGGIAVKIMDHGIHLE